MKTKCNKIKVYIAGPMRGHKEDNYPEFYKAEKYLEDKGIYDTVNPARMDNEEYPYEHDCENVDYKEALKRDIDEIFKVHSMYMLRGWEKSEGAKVEHALAIYLGLNISYQ
jgi:hypothetical protein